MKTLEKGQEKINKICAALRDETLEPAQKEAQKIIEAAQNQATQILAEAQKNIEKAQAQNKASLEREFSVFESSLQQAAKQTVETLRQNIEKNFFNENLSTIIEKGSSDPKLIANVINAIVKALEKDGLAADLTAVVSKTASPRELNELLMEDVLKSLKENTVIPGNFKAGVQIKVSNKKMMIDISEEALKELLATYVVRKDFRKMIFSNLA